MRVLNSHSHYDHVGGNHLFNEILSPGTNFSQGMSAGLPHTEIADEVSDAALCRSLPDGVLAADHRIRPYTITRRVRDGELIDLGGRQLEVILLPGHTPDSLGLLDRERGFFWPGDSFYEGPIWLFMPETDLAAYRQSVRRMADLASSLMAVFPSHNTPRAAPRRLTELSDALERVLAGTASGVPIDNDRIEFGFSSFSLLIAKQQLGTTDVN